MLQRGTHAEEYGEDIPKQQTHSPNHRSLLCPLELPPVLATALRILSAYVLQRFSWFESKRHGFEGRAVGQREEISVVLNDPNVL